MAQIGIITIFFFRIGVKSIMSWIIGIKTYQCGICSKKLKSSSKLKVHVITVHEGLKNYKCEECNKAFGTQGVLTTHIERVHKRTETHVCELCGKSYNNPQNLVYHMKVHSGIKEFQCHYCGQEFFSKSCMQLHAKRIHEDFKPHKEWTEFMHWKNNEFLLNENNH